MSGFLDRLAAHAHGRAPLVTARPPARFEAERPVGTGSRWAEGPGIPLPTPEDGDLVEDTVGVRDERDLTGAPSAPIVRAAAPVPVSRDPAQAGQPDVPAGGPPRTAAPDDGVATRGRRRPPADLLDGESTPAAPAAAGPPPVGPQPPGQHRTHPPGLPDDGQQAPRREPGSGWRAVEKAGSAGQQVPRVVDVPPDLPPRSRPAPAALPVLSTRRDPDPRAATTRRHLPVDVTVPSVLLASEDLLAVHVVPALVDAGLVAPDQTDVVRLGTEPVVHDDAPGARDTAGRPQVHVHIGRVEVHQAPPAPPPRAPEPARRPTSRPGPPEPDHDAYLARRRQQGRR